MTLHSFSRWTAFLTHLVISALIAATVVLLVVWLWYPAPYFKAMGGETLLRLLIGVDVVLGPVITLVIFDPAKPRLKYDLATIGALQFAALVYGGYVMFDARPVYNVFVKDRFNTVSARAPDQFRSLPLTGPRVVAGLVPENAEERSKIMLESVAGGPDVQDRPHLYVPYDQVRDKVASVARPLVGLAQKDRESAMRVSEFVAERGAGRSLGYVPVRARNQDFTAVVDRKTGEIVGFLDVDPW
jgi:hypothetical protein